MRQTWGPIVVLCALAFAAGACADDGQPIAAERDDSPTTSSSAPVDLATQDANPTFATEEVEPPPPSADQADAADPDETPEFRDLALWSGFNIEVYDVQPTDECVSSTPDTRVCEFSQAGVNTASHLGIARDEESGTVTIHLDETCTMSDGTEANLVVVDATGTMTTAWGDEAFFTLRNTYCGATIPDPGTSLAYWVIDGGTGRFADAYGVMFASFWPGDEYLTVSTGILRVRTELWDDLIPGRVLD